MVDLKDKLVLSRNDQGGWVVLGGAVYGDRIGTYV